MREISHATRRLVLLLREIKSIYLLTRHVPPYVADARPSSNRSASPWNENEDKRYSAALPSRSEVGVLFAPRSRNVLQEAWGEVNRQVIRKSRNNRLHERAQHLDTYLHALIDSRIFRRGDLLFASTHPLILFRSNAVSVLPYVNAAQRWEQRHLEGYFHPHPRRGECNHPRHR